MRNSFFIHKRYSRYSNTKKAQEADPKAKEENTRGGEESREEGGKTKLSEGIKCKSQFCGIQCKIEETIRKNSDQKDLPF